MAERDTLCGWGDRRKIAYFVENHEVIVPRRGEQLAMMVDLLPLPPDAQVSVLDLGSGFGVLTEQILIRFPRATVTCVDGSSAIIELARDRLSKTGTAFISCMGILRLGNGGTGLEDPLQVRSRYSQSIM
jgi:2-polyprenyl-3-methyl-5-hydroxy-6-metoxy-1,4-benzoquinol methylase